MQNFKFQDELWQCNSRQCKLLQQLKEGFKRTMSWNKYQSKVSMQAQNQYLYYLIDPRLFVLLFENEVDSLGHTRYLLKVEISVAVLRLMKEFFFDIPINNDKKQTERWLHNSFFIRLSLFQKNIYISWLPKI